MAENPIKTPLPADLPEDWTGGQTVAPTGAEVGLSEQHGYNYLMEQVNAAQTAAKEIGEAFSGLATLGPDGKVPAGQLPDIGGFYEVEEAVPPASRKANTLYGLILADYTEVGTNMLYVWNKYYIKHVAKETVTSDKWYISFPVICCSGYTLDNQGKFYPTTTLSTLEDSRYLDRMPSSRDEYLIDHGKYIMYNAGDDGRWMVTDDSKLYHSEGSFRRYVAEKTYGELIQTVTSRNEAEYPKNGVKDGYYYIYQSAKPEISSIDVPDAAMVGQTIDITWESADSAENYKLERRVDSGGWTQVYAGVALVYNDRAQAEWTSVQYRVSASISGVYGDPILSKTVNIVPSDALRIYMTEGNIGEIHGAITYTALALDLNSPFK